MSAAASTTDSSSSPPLVAPFQMAPLSISQQHIARMPQQPRQAIHLSPLDSHVPQQAGGARNMQQLDANWILSRMVTAQVNQGSGNLPIRMASMQDFRRSVDELTNSQQLMTPELRRPIDQPNQLFNLSNRRASDPYGPQVPTAGPRVNPMLKLVEERMAAQQNIHGDKPDQVGPLASPYMFETAPATSGQQGAPQASMNGPSANLMLKLMEERMAAAASLQKENIQDKPIQDKPIQAQEQPPVKLAASTASQDEQAAFQASVNKWAGIEGEVKAQSMKQIASLKSFHKAPGDLPSILETNEKSPPPQTNLSSKQHEMLQQLILEQQLANCHQQRNQVGVTAQQSSPNEKSPLPLTNLSSKQQEMLQQLILEQQLANCQQQRDQVGVTARQLPPVTTLPTADPLGFLNTVPAQPGLGRCAVSFAEVDRLRRENQAIQLRRQQALEDRVNGQFYLLQRSIAASALASNNQNITTSPGSTDSLNKLKKMAPYRKRGSQDMEDDDAETICTSGSNTASLAGSHTPSVQSHASISSKSRRLSFSASMENLRINNGNYESRLQYSRNQSFSNGLNTAGRHASMTNTPGLISNEGHARLNTKSQSLSSGLNLHRSSTKTTSGLKKVPSRKGAFIQCLLSVQNELAKQPTTIDIKNSPTAKSTSTKTGIDHNLSGQQKCQEKMIMSDLPDRIKYQNAQTDEKPMDVVMQALKSRGFACSEIKPSLEMPDDFFIQSSENYVQEAVDAIRSNDIESLRKFHSNGTNLQCANKFGESLIHLACRRSHRNVVSFLVNEAGVSLCVRDDFGRTPFHDACWRGELDLELIDMILDREPKLLMLSDKRGHTPLDYTRREHWAELIPFLIERSDKFQPA